MRAKASRRDTEQRVPGHGRAADHQVAECLHVHLVAGRRERDEPGHIVVGHVSLGGGTRPAQARSAESARHDA
jgi:diadenosine tetraphosphate (Ap4A) HIT family hydrolase